MKIYQQNLEKARKEYKRTGKMNRNRACILLNCNTAMGYFQSKEIKEKLYEREIHTLIIMKTIELIKKIEKKCGVGEYLNYKCIVAIAFYVSLQLNNSFESVNSVCSLFDSGEAIFNRLFHRIKKKVKELKDIKNIPKKILKKYPKLKKKPLKKKKEIKKKEIKKNDIVNLWIFDKDVFKLGVKCITCNFKSLPKLIIIDNACFDCKYNEKNKGMRYRKALKGRGNRWFYDKWRD